MKVDKFKLAFPEVDGNIPLCVEWTNYMLRNRGGVLVWRAPVFSELMYISEFYNMCEKRINNSAKGDKRYRDEWMNKVSSDIHRCLMGKDVEPFEDIDTEIVINGHKLARYKIRPMKTPQFTLSGTVYQIKDDGIKRVGGEIVNRPVVDVDHDKLYGGNCANPDGTLKEEFESFVDDTVEASWKTQDARAIIDQKYQESAKAMQDASDNDVPFSVVDESKPSGDSPDTKNVDKGDKPIKLSKNEQKELDKFGLTLDNIPDKGDKPSGFRKKTWVSIHQKLAA